MRPTILAALCLVGAGVAACADGTTSNPPVSNVAAVAPPTSDTPPLGRDRAAIIRGQLPSDVGDRVFFAYDSSELSPDAQRVLQRQATFLRGAPATSLTIEGHADERGTREYNLALGDRRANAVRDFLVARGVPADHLRTFSYGKERPQVAGHDEATWAQNRRAVSVPPQ